VQNALKNLEGFVTYFCVLGSYTMAVASDVSGMRHGVRSQFLKALTSGVVIACWAATPWPSDSFTAMLHQETQTQPQ